MKALSSLRHTKMIPEIIREDNCLYLTQDLIGMNIYDRAKAIVNFCDKETKLFEKEIDRLICDIFKRNNINVPNTEKSVLKLAFDLLKSKGKDIEIIDLYKSECELKKVKTTKNHFTVMLEEDRYLQCGVEVVERQLWTISKK